MLPWYGIPVPANTDEQTQTLIDAGVLSPLLSTFNRHPNFKEARIDDLKFWVYIMSEEKGGERYSQLKVYAAYKSKELAPRPNTGCTSVTVAANTIESPWLLEDDSVLTLEQLETVQRLVLNPDNELGIIGTRLVRTGKPIEGFHPTAYPEGTELKITGLTFTKLKVVKPGTTHPSTLPRELLGCEAGYFRAVS